MPRLRAAPRCPDAAQMNELFLFVSEQAHLARRLCGALGLPERASLAEIVGRLDSERVRGALARPAD